MIYNGDSLETFHDNEICGKLLLKILVKAFTSKVLANEVSSLMVTSVQFLPKIHLVVLAIHI